MCADRRTSSAYLVDRSGTRYELTDPRWRGADGSPLAVSRLPGLTSADIVVGERSLWRYAPVIPVDQRHRISLGEGATPMPLLDWGEHRVHFKLEWFNPTASFKDRGVSVMMSHLRSQGAQAVLEDSSGNGGSSVAAYAAAAGVHATILVPEATSASKVVQARAHGAELVFVSGTRDDVGDEAIRRSARIPYASHNWHPMFVQGVKTIGYEIWEALGFTAPDNIVVVAGSGSLVLGCDLAFTELLSAGAIDRRPRLLVGQPRDWAAIADTVNRIHQTGQRAPTIAEGAAIARPVRLPEVVAAIGRSAGAAVAVTEDEIVSALRALASHGLFVEPTSAVAAAALDRFISDGIIRRSETTVVVLTGTGAKTSDRIAAVVG
ncbi:threonine synthase [Gordonia sp. NPDC003422]